MQNLGLTYFRGKASGVVSLNTRKSSKCVYPTMLKIKLKPNIDLTKNLLRFKEQNEKLQYR